MVRKHEIAFSYKTYSNNISFKSWKKIILDLLQKVFCHLNSLIIILKDNMNCYYLFF